MAKVCALVGAIALSAAMTPDASARQRPAAVVVSESEAARRADALLARMTLEEKAGQLSQYFYIDAVPPLAAKIEADIAGGKVGALLFVSDPKKINRLQRIATEQTRLKIPLLFGFDVIHGWDTIMPVPIALAATWDPALVEQVQTVAAQEARAAGINWTFAPMVDVSLDPRWGRRVEAAGEDVHLGSVMAAAQVRGFQGPALGTPGRIMAGPKHFAGYGAAIGGRDYDAVDLPESQLWNVYLPPFKAALDAGAGNVMSAYMALNGVPATANRWLLHDVLRDAWKFKGFVVSDADATSSLTTHGLTNGAPDAAVRAIRAGVDMEMVSPRGTAVMPNVVGEVAAGHLSVADVDAAVRPILETKFRLGLFDQPFVDETAAAKMAADPTHDRIARTAAARSAVLLRNEGGLLPLDRTKIASIALIGPLADSPVDTNGPWTFHPKSPAVSVLAGLRAKVGRSVRIDYVEGARLPDRIFPSPFAAMAPKVTKPPIDGDAEITRAVAAATAADVAVLVLGEGQDMIGEAASRASLDLPGRQQELLDAVIATGKPVVVLLMTARPLSLGASKPRAIMDIWYPGSQGGSAVADLLLGDAAPGGKLPFSWIRSAAQAPASYAHLIPHDPANVFSRYWDGSSEPTYPFGFGLSYTSFTYSALTVDRPHAGPDQRVQIGVDIANTGSRTGDEVAQLYLHQRSGTSSRPVRELKSFQRVTLKPGEKRRLTFTLLPEDRRYWSEATRGWVADNATFDVFVGGNSAADLSTSFTIDPPATTGK